jgi:ABC-type sugar transport system permease subunit
VTDNSLDVRAVQFSGIAARLKRLDASLLLWLALIAVLAFLVLNPILRLVVSSLQETDSGSFTLANYRVAYGNVRHLQALVNSLELGIGVALLATCFGVPIAWAISRTDMPGKAFIRLMVFAAFVTPPYLGAIGWILLAGPNSGWLNKIWMALTGAGHGIFNIYSMTGLILVIAVTSFPYTFVFTSTRCPHAPDHAARYTAVGDARDHRRHHHQLSRSHRAVRRARADRIARPFQCGVDAALAVFRISGPRRGGCRLCDAVTRHYRVDVLAAAQDIRP